MRDAVRCSRCGAEFSQKAHFCQHCGPGAFIEGILVMPKVLAVAVTLGVVLFFALAAKDFSQDLASAAGGLTIALR